MWLDPMPQPVKNGFKRPHSINYSELHPHLLEWGRFAYLEGIYIVVKYENCIHADHY